MLSRLKRRTPSSSSRAPITDDDDFPAGPPSPTLSASGNSSVRFSSSVSPTKSRNGSTDSPSAGRTLSPERARTRDSRSSSFNSIHNPSSSAHSSASNLSALSDYPGAGLGNGTTGVGLGVGGGAVGKGNLSLEHLQVESGAGTPTVHAPEVVIAAASPVYGANGGRFDSGASDSQLMTPLASAADRHFDLPAPGGNHVPRAVSQSHSGPSHSGGPLAVAGRPRSATMYETCQPNGLHALAGHNVPSGVHVTDASGHSSTLHVDGAHSGSPSRSRSASRPASRSASRSSSVNEQQYPDSLGPRPTSMFGSSSKALKRQKSAQGGLSGIAGALALSGVALASPSPQLRQPLPLARKSQDTVPGRESSDSAFFSEEQQTYGTDGLLSMDALGDFDDVVSQLGTGYAVASSKRNADFHQVFKNIPEDDYLIEGEQISEMDRPRATC